MTTDVETRKYFSSPVGTLSIVACATRETFDGTSCLPIRLGTETSNLIFGGNGGGTAKAELDASAAAKVNGTISYCFSSVSTDHGRYVGNGTTAVRTGPINPLYEYDNNHMKVLNDYILLLQTGYNTAHPLLASDGAGALVDKVAYPNISNMTNYKMVITARAVDLKVPSDFHIGMHHQGELRNAKKIGSGNAGVGAFPCVNAMNHTNVLGFFGFGNGGIFSNNTVNYVADSGWVEITIPFSPSDSQWSMMLGNEDKDGHELASYNKSLLYTGTDAKTLVGPNLWIINSYLCGFRWNANRGVPGTNSARPAVSPRFEPTGTIYVSKIEFFDNN
jgi:hypothetical protein